MTVWHPLARSRALAAAMITSYSTFTASVSSIGHFKCWLLLCLLSEQACHVTVCQLHGVSHDCLQTSPRFINTAI